MGVAACCSPDSPGLLVCMSGLLDTPALLPLSSFSLGLPRLPEERLLKKNSINKPYQWLNLKVQCPVWLGCVFTQDSIFTWTFLKISLSQMVSRLATPILSSAVFLLKAKCSSHFFSGLSAWLNICRDMRQACIQDDSQKKERLEAKVEVTEVWPYRTCGWADVEPQERLLASVSANHPSKVEYLPGRTQFGPHGWGWHPEKAMKHFVHKVAYRAQQFKK